MRGTRGAIVAVVLGSLVVSPQLARAVGTPTQIADIRLGPASSDPNWLTELGPITLFTATDDATGNELWKTNGTEAGTTLVRDIYPGDFLSSAPHSFHRMGGTVFFAAGDPNAGYEQWKTDGTTTGTRRVKNINPTGDSLPIQEMTDIDGTLFFTANDGTSGLELWKSDEIGRASCRERVL